MVSQEQKKSYYQKHKDERRKYRQIHKKQLNEYYRKYCKEHKEKKAEYRKKNYQKLKLKVFEKLGNKCFNPYNLFHPDWCNDSRCLQIDHVNGGGVEEHKRVNVYKFLKRVLVDTNGNYQLLCANCNWIKRYEKGETNYKR
jgi:hypothetical protein